MEFSQVSRKRLDTYAYRQIPHDKTPTTQTRTTAKTGQPSQPDTHPSFFSFDQPQRQRSKSANAQGWLSAAKITARAAPIDRSAHPSAASKANLQPAAQTSFRGNLACHRH